jgi:hypothetical protein
MDQLLYLQLCCIPKVDHGLKFSHHGVVLRRRIGDAVFVRLPLSSECFALPKEPVPCSFGSPQSPVYSSCCPCPHTPAKEGTQSDHAEERGDANVGEQIVLIHRRASIGRYDSSAVPSRTPANRRRRQLGEGSDLTIDVFGGWLPDAGRAATDTSSVISDPSSKPVGSQRSGGATGAPISGSGFVPDLTR